MRWKNLSGTKPRDRHSDRRKTALAAIAVLLLVAPSARAGMVELNIDTSLSSLGFTQRIWDPALGPNYLSIPFEFGNYQYTPGPWANPSNVTSTWGKVYADWNPGVSLQFSSLSAVNYNISGIALPSRDNVGNINTNPTQLAPTQIALEMTNPTLDAHPARTATRVGIRLCQHPRSVANVRFGGPDDGRNLHRHSTACCRISVATTTLLLLRATMLNRCWRSAGFEDLLGLVTDILTLYDGAANDTPFPSPFAGNVATFDGVTLTLPLTFSFTYGDPGDTIYEVNTFGTLVAHVVVPEPSSMIMLGCGVAGLLSYGWRARKRRNLVA